MNNEKPVDIPNNEITKNEYTNKKNDESKKSAETNTENSTIASSKDSHTICSDISEPLQCINNINSLKNAICELPLNPCERKYIDTYIQPLSIVLDEFIRFSVDLANSVNFLASTTLVNQRTEELIESVNLIYDVNNECEKIYDIVKNRLNKIICPVESDIKRK